MTTRRTCTWVTVTTLFALAFLLLRLGAVEVEVPQDGEKPWHVFADYYFPPRNALEAAIDVSDGQAWAALGNDPLASRPERFFGDSVEFVYRAQRPLIGWIVWALSLGNRRLVPYSLAAVTVLSAGALTWATFLLARGTRREDHWAPLVAAMPGVMLSVVILSPDPLPVETQGLDRLSGPFEGWMDAPENMDGQAVVGWLMALGLLVAAVRRAPLDPLTWAALGFAVSTTLMGSNVLGTEAYRPLLAMYTFSFVATLPPRKHDAGESAGFPSHRPDHHQHSEQSEQECRADPHHPLG
ncbi:MAG: hypothetical protein KatS3mg008_1671 [Acidimicrobiales bacterium]|nr:MAG: hypothetical protein KatS3mg008_1671 [Acidimicrobiales bacterium]